MIEPRLPKFQWGQRVRCLIDLVNDGTYPNAEEDAVLAAAGAQGEIVQVGSHVDSNTPVYIVEFEEKYVIGCLEEEIEAA
ncbi:nitrogen fixation protein NifZ [Rhodoblastus sp.]|jgi:nitrogen fixation protein NifZ|uniref:nitrogen fixation protein NifZ n=1 Tax=Rhodoblastus sp. TaxID=1962975 RepID=UPI0025CDD127|nr:nitrogen fixation protein NifZ [Rhodoblastus sp.]